MLPNIFFFTCLFFILGIISKYYFSFWFLGSLVSLFFFRKFIFIILFFLIFLLGGSYLILFQDFQKFHSDNYLHILKEFSSTNYYHKYLGNFKGKNYFVYLPYYYDKLFPKDKIKANFEIVENKIFIKEIIAIKKSIYSPIYIFRNYINGLINKNYSLITSEIVSGILYGKEIDDKELTKIFKNSGLAHITAMSGYNLIIISSIVHRLFRFIVSNFYLLNFLSVFFILLFIIFTGFQSSVVRAGIMVIVFIISKLIGKPVLQRNLLIFTVVLITLVNPLALINDLGFQLSILATIGIVYLEEYFRKFLKFKNLSETISAQLLVLPFIWYKFGELNLFSFFNNMIIIPIIPYLMIIGFIALLIFFLYPLNQIINFIFESFKIVVDLLSQLPKIYLPSPLTFTLIIYLLLILLIVKVNKNEKLDFNFNFS